MASAAAIRGHVDAERGDAAIGACFHGAVRPQLRVDGAGDGGFVPYAKAFAPERVIAQVLLHAQDCRFAGAMRIRRVRHGPLPAVVGVGVLVGAELHVQHVAAAALQRLVAAHGKHLGRIRGLRRRAHVDDQRVTRRVRRRDHVVQRALGQDLRLVEHLDVHAVEATTETILTGTEHDAGSVDEHDSLLVIRPSRLAVNEPAYRLALHQSAHELEPLVACARPMRGPQHLQWIVAQDAQHHDHRADQKRLSHLTAEADDHATDTGRIHAIGSLAKDAAAQSPLPAVVLDAAQPRLSLHLRPAGRHNILGQHHMPRHIGQLAPVGSDARPRSDRTVHPLPPSRSAHWPRRSRIQDAQSPDSPQAAAGSTTPNHAAAYPHQTPQFQVEEACV